MIYSSDIRRWVCTPEITICDPLTQFLKDGDYFTIPRLFLFFWALHVVSADLTIVLEYLTALILSETDPELFNAYLLIGRQWVTFAPSFNQQFMTNGFID
jgi:hypothetical protein